VIGVSPFLTWPVLDRPGAGGDLGPLAVIRQAWGPAAWGRGNDSDRLHVALYTQRSVQL